MMKLMQLLKPYIVALFAFSFLSGCFAVQQQDRSRLVAGLQASVWPVLSGIYSETNIETGEVIEGFRTIRRKIVRGQRIYVVDGNPNEFFAFYPQGNNIYVLEQHDPSDSFASVFTYVLIDQQSGAIGSFGNQCSDLSEQQRSTLFGNPAATTCLVRTANGSLSNLGMGGLIDMLNLSMRAKGEIQSVYRLERQVTDALQ